MIYFIATVRLLLYGRSCFLYDNVVVLCDNFIQSSMTVLSLDCIVDKHRAISDKGP